MNTDVDTDPNNEHAREVGRATRDRSQPWPPVGGLASAHRSSYADGYQRQRQADTKAQHQNSPECDFLHLQA